MPDRSRLLGYKELLVGNRNYRLWFLSGLGSSFGDWIGLFALQVLVVSLAPSGSRLALFGLGGIMMARLLPSVVFGPVAGVVADRYDRKRLMFVADVSRGALFLAVAFSRELLTLLVLTFLIECLSLLYISAKDSSLPQIVERRHLTQANQMNLFVTYGPLPLGALTATVLVSIAGFLAGMGLPDVGPLTFALLANAATFFVSGLIILGLHLPDHARQPADGQEAPRILDELQAGFRFIRDLPLIRALITGVVGVAFGAGVVVALGPEFVRTDLGRPESDWFGLVASVGTGLLVGILAVPVLTNRISKERLFPPCLAGAAAMATIIATLPSLRLASVVGFFLGVLVGISFVSGYTLVHEHTRDDMRARTFAAFYTGTRASMFAALALGPLLAGLIGRFSLGAGGGVVTMSGVRITMLAGGLAALLSAVWAWRTMYRAVREQAPGQRATLQLRTPARVPTGGLFIVLEGGEGTGKSTQMRALVTALEGEGRAVVATREPGGPPISERIRELLLDPASGSMDARTEALLYAAARAEHVERVIRPALDAGKVVVCDRFLDSSVAYQGFARGLGVEVVAEINRWAVGGVEPDAVVLLDLDVAEGLRRAGERSGATSAGAGRDRIEREDAGFHARVADGFRSLADREPERVVVVDGRGSADVVAQRVRAALARWLPMPEPPPPERDRPTGQPEARR